MHTQLRQFFTLTFTLGAFTVYADVTHLVTVSGKANIYASGASAVPNLPGGGGVLPPAIALGDAGRGRSMQVGPVTGIVDCCNGAEPNGPDGNVDHGGTSINAYNGVSGIRHNSRRMFLVGVFLADTAPTVPAPTTLDFSADFAELNPLLAQVFYIGNGRTAAGQPRLYRIPEGATRLFLGFADANFFLGAPGYYDDNTGSLSVSLNIDRLRLLPSEATDAVAGPQRLFVLAGQQIHVLDRTSLASVRSPITVSQPGLRSLNAIALWRDQNLLVAGTVDGTSGNTVMFVRAYDPTPVPERVLWTWIGATSATVTSITGGSSADCVYVAGNTTRIVNGQSQPSGLVAKLKWGGILHWEQYVGQSVAAISAHPSFSNVQVVGNYQVANSFVSSGFFQVLAESGGIPGPLSIWTADSKWLSYGFTRGRSVAAAGPGRGVYAVGVEGTVQAPNGGVLRLNLMRYSFDGTLLWKNEFQSSMRSAAVIVPDVSDVVTDDGGVWVGGTLARYGTPGAQAYLRYFSFGGTDLMQWYDGDPAFPGTGIGAAIQCKALAARAGTAYMVGSANNASNSPMPGVVMKVTRR